jgi:hypothetical protein
MSREPALLTSAGRMPERSQHRVSEGQRAPIRPGGLVDVANVRRRGVGSPEPRGERYNLHTALPQARPPPKPHTTIVLPGPIRPARHASSIASGIEPLEVLP